LAENSFARVEGFLVQKDAGKIGIRRRAAATATRRVLDASFLAGSGSTLEHIAAHLETDILKPVPAVRLMTEYQVLDSGPGQFEQKKLKLWLPL
jgi:hypothetical protein